MLINLSEIIEQKWNTILQIHKLSKKFQIMSEEYSLELEIFLQPMKEMRDAYEHICRAYSSIVDLNGNINVSEKDEKYILKNLDKAISHEYRGLFDTVDYLSISLRERISELLDGYTYKQLISIYPDYKTKAIFLAQVPKQIAKLRNDKDIADDKMNDILEKYESLIDELCDCYFDLVINLGKD